MSVSDTEEKIEWGAESEPGKYERVPSSGALYCLSLSVSFYLPVFLYYMSNKPKSEPSFSICLPYIISIPSIFFLPITVHKICLLGTGIR
jgi:hypothetical protein